MEKAIFVIILLCSLECLKYYFRLIYKEFKEFEEENKYSEPDEIASSAKPHHFNKKQK